MVPDWIALDWIYDWFMSLGAQYGVNPIVFGAIYVGAIPFFTLSVAWIIRNVRRGKPLALPVLSAMFFLVSAYLYLIVVGRNIPVWVYVFIAAMVGYSLYTTFARIRRAARRAEAEAERQARTPPTSDPAPGLTTPPDASNSPADQGDDARPSSAAPEHTEASEAMSSSSVPTSSSSSPSRPSGAS
jgi:hypothetical protein